MKKLTQKEMRAAIFARNCDTNPDFKYGIEAARALADTPYRRDGSIDHKMHKSLIEKEEKMYKLGKKVLERHTLKFTDRSTCHTYANGRIPGEDHGKSDALRIEAGYVGSMQAYDTAVFNPRGATK